MPQVNPLLFREGNAAEPASPVSRVANVVPTGAPVPINEVPQGLPGAVAKQSQVQAAMYQPAGWWASLGAGLTETETANAYRFMTMPDYPAEKDPPRFEMQQRLPFTLDEHEQKRWDEAQSTAELQWLQDRFQSRRDAFSAAGQHPAAFMLSQTIDPAYLAMGAGFATLAKGAEGATAARTIGAVGQGAGAFGVSLAADQVAPMSTPAFVANVLLNMAGGALISKEGKLVPKDRDFPTQELDDALAKFRSDFVGPAPYGVEEVTKPKLRLSSGQGGKPHITKVGEQTTRRARETPPELQPYAPPTDPVRLRQIVIGEVESEAAKRTKRTGEMFEWNLQDDFRKLGDAGAEVGGDLVDDNRALSKTSAESIKRGVQAELVDLQVGFESEVRSVMKERGHGTWSYLTARRATREAQVRLENELQTELLRRQDLHNRGLPILHDGIDPAIKRLADAHDKTTARALDMMHEARVQGIEDVTKLPGYFNRVWSSAKFDDLEAAFVRAGSTAEQAHQHVVQLVKRGLMRKNTDWSDPLAYDIAAAIVDRTKNKGLLIDPPPGAQIGAGHIAQIRDELRNLGIRPENMQRVIDVVAGKVDEAGKVSFLKHRLDVDFNEVAVVGGRTYRLSEMLESNVITLLDKYIDKVSGRIALTKKGYGTSSEISKRRETLLAKTGRADRERAAWLFDSTINRLLGNPVGDRMNQTLRNGAAVNRMVALGASGVWQTTEYATPMVKYGMLRTMKYAMKEMPVFRHLMSDAAEGGRMQEILISASEQNFRLRPYIDRFEDNFDIPMNSRLTMALQQGNNLVPYINLMKFIHGHQARLVSNLVLDTLRQAAKGSAKHQEALAKYGIQKPVLEQIGKEMQKHGFNVDRWDQGVWSQARSTFVKMMDESVLHARMGDIPAFAQFDNVGKFIFTFRSFILTAHNKLLVGTAARDGLIAASLMAMYQFPLAVLATQSNAYLTGKGRLDDKELIYRSIGQMGSIGLLGEMWSWITGTKSEVGSPGLIPFDRAIRAGQSVGAAAFHEGSAAEAATDVASAMPIIGIMPGIRNLQHLGD